MFQTNLAKSRKYVLIGTSLIVIILILLIVGLRTSNNTTKPEEITRQQLILNLPHLTKTFTIVYSKNKDQIYINVLNPPYEENRLKALEWIQTQGIDPNKLNISYTPRNKFNNPNP